MPSAGFPPPSRSKTPPRRRRSPYTVRSRSAVAVDPRERRRQAVPPFFLLATVRRFPRIPTCPNPPTSTSWSSKSRKQTKAIAPMTIKDRFAGNPCEDNRTNHKLAWATARLVV
uniref:Uncharacterized protein n=1 Tax=Leersia perrieri TaxID=77586 RepID=A0A0D9V5K4_9ORYZ